MNPHSGIPFDPSPAFFLGEFDVYDREESLGEYLNQYDPNDRSVIGHLLLNLFFQGARAQELTSAHKRVLVESLLGALRNPDYDFYSLFEPEDGDVFCLPFDWEIENGRLFFEEVYRLVLELWEPELRHEGAQLPSLSELGIPSK